MAEPERVAGGVMPSGVEYQPAATASGASDPGGQNTGAPPQGEDVGLAVPTGQK
jgi:hypothetical protein